MTTNVSNGQTVADIDPEKRLNSSEKDGSSGEPAEVETPVSTEEEDLLMGHLHGWRLYLLTAGYYIPEA